MAVNVAGLVVVVLLYVGMLGVGVWAGWRGKRRKEGGREAQPESEDFMVAGRSFNGVIGTLTMTATFVGGAFINGTAEAVYTAGSGLLWAQAPFGLALSLLIGGVFFAKKMRSAGFTTLFDPFQQKFGRFMCVLLYLPSVLSEIFYSSTILAALGTTLSVILKLDLRLSILISTSVAVLYTLLGGLYSVAYTDVLQLIFIFIGLWLCIPFAMTHQAVASITEDTSWLGQWDNRLAAVWVDLTLMMALGSPAIQGYIQRVLAARSAHEARLFSVFGCFGCLLLAAPPVLIGAIGASTDWNQTALLVPPVNDTDKIAPLVIQYLTPPAVSVVGLGTVSAAVMSSVDSSILGAASVFGRNIYKGILRPRASEREVVWLVRLSIVNIGACAALVALTSNTIIGLWYLSSELVYVILLPQVVCVLFVRFSNSYGSLAGFTVGLILRIAAGEPLLNMAPFVRYPFYSDELGQLFPFRTLAMLASLVSMVIISGMSHVGFIRGVLPTKLDVFHCYRNECDLNASKMDVDMSVFSRKYNRSCDLDLTSNEVIDTEDVANVQE
ncbi:high-affinity choline transporter 1-like [Branchiostoma lanceolatum]|uniref:high-affinity choline transporter 1-like n=1 Tax=Branchiostoma lanceolatum TaxID=7740 RepID=UPI003451A2EA